MKVRVEAREHRFYNGRTEYRIDKEESEFCCESLKNVVGWDDGYGFGVNNSTAHPMLRLCIYKDYYDGDEGTDHDVDYCPFCGEKIEVLK